MEDEKPNDDFSNNVFTNMMNLFFNPEITKRKAENSIDDSFELLAAQAIIFPDERQTIINLNSEVSAIVKLKKVANKDNDGFKASTEQIEYVKLKDEEFLNCGHVTIILFNDGYHISFDFQYNKQISREHLKAAEQFIETSKFALDNKYITSFIDNSYSAIELLAKTNLLLEANSKVAGKTIHKTIHSTFNLRFKNSHTAFEIQRRKTLNDLTVARKNARYLEGKIYFEEEKLTEIYHTISHLFNDLSNRAN